MSAFHTFSFQNLRVFNSIQALFIFVSALVVTPTEARAQTSAQVWLTTSDRSNALTQKADIPFATDAGAGLLTVNINDTVTYQRMDGFGGQVFSFDGYFYHGLPVAARDAAMRSLFDRTTGIGLSFIRIASTDEHSPTYDYMPPGQTDPTLSRFSISEDMETKIPLLKQALAINPDLRILSSSWSPPGWMKTSASIIGGSLLTQYYGVWAQYFVKIVQAYQAQGIPIYALTVQNEPDYNPPYAGMVFPPDQEAMFIGQYLGPAFESAGIKTKIVAGDTTGFYAYYGLAVLNNPAANKYTAGTAFHWYGGTPDAMTTVHNAFPTKEIWETEAASNCTGLGSRDFGDGIINDMQKLVIGSTRNWAAGVLKFPVFNWNPDATAECLGIMWVNNAAGVAVPQSAYYSLGHASKFVRTGAYRIESNTFDNNLETVAFKNPDGSIAVVVANVNYAAQTFKMAYKGRSFSYQMPGRSVASFTWGGTPTPYTTPIASAPASTPSGSPDVIVTALSYANGQFTSTVKNQGSIATPSGVGIGVGFFVDSVYKSSNLVSGPLAAGASVTIISESSYTIPGGSHAIMAYVDDVNRFAESNETNNQLSQTITVGAGATATPTTTSTTTGTFLMTLEAENMSTKTTGAAITNGWNLWSDGYIEQTVNFPSAGTYTFDIVAAGQMAANTWPLMEMRIDGVSQGAKSVTSGTFTAYRFTVTSMAAGSRRVAVAFTNDYYAPPEDRDLYVDKVSIASTATTSTTPTTTTTATSLPDVVVTSLSYASGKFTATVKNQGSAAVPAGMMIGVGYSVDGQFKSWGTDSSSGLAVGASVTIGTGGGNYTIPDGTHDILAFVDDTKRFTESDENNNTLSQIISVGAGATASTPAAASVLSPTLTPPTLINAGGSAFTDPQGKLWNADFGSSGGNVYSTTAAISGTTTPALYQSERYGNFQYQYNVPVGSYVVTLKFAEIYHTQSGKRLFNVLINGQAVLSNFDIVAQAGALTALDKQFTVNASSGQIAIQFVALVDSAKISAISIQPASAPTTATSLPDVVVTSLSYASGKFTATVKNQGSAAVPAGMMIGVGYSVDGQFKSWGTDSSSGLAVGASVTIGTGGGNYTIPDGTHDILAFVDDTKRFTESDENNNTLSQTITVGAAATTTSTTGTFSQVLEAESMPTKTTGAAIANGWNIWSDGYIEQTLNFPSAGTYAFEVAASGIMAKNISPIMHLRIDGVSKGSVSVTGSSFAPYRFTVTSMTAGSHRVAIAFTNDYYAPPEDRDLYVDKITITK